jgi:hypothetical protein
MSGRWATRLGRWPAASIDNPEALNALLREVDNLEESLLTGLELTHHGYSVDVRFEHLRRGKPVPQTSQVTVVMEAVSALHLTGGLSETMVQHPEQINWGLSEVAHVSAYEARHGVGLLVEWEDDREIRVEAARVRFNAAPG